MGKSVQKSYDERMQDLEKRMAALKAEKKKRDARHITAIGTAVSRQYYGSSQASYASTVFYRMIVKMAATRRRKKHHGQGIMLL